MWPNKQETADLITFIEEILNGNLIFVQYYFLKFYIAVTLFSVLLSHPRFLLVLT